MKLYRYSNYDNTIFISVLVPYVVCLNWLLLGEQYLADWGLFWKVTVVVLPVIFVLYRVIALCAVKRMRARIPGHKHVVKRGFLLLPIVFATQALFVTLLFQVFSEFPFFAFEPNIVNYDWAILATLVMSIISAGLNEAAYALEQWKDTLIETERLTKKNLQSSLDRLKKQVNPHFLFNSLNCLSSLISENTAKAEEFLHEMSIVYRYLLNKNEESLATLDSELKFIQSYYHMQKTRYDEGLELTIDVEEKYRSYLLPTLTLQLLVENAIKHNSVLAETPLRIQIYSAENDRLIVANNLQPKLAKPFSSGIGLANIVNKYSLLNQRPVEVSQTKKQFLVAVSLIPDMHEMV